jgi:hypothetical protein
MIDMSCIRNKDNIIVVDEDYVCLYQKVMYENVRLACGGKLERVAMHLYPMFV